MSTLELLKPFLKEDQLNELLKLIENNKLLEAIRCLRSYTGHDLLSAGKVIKKIAKEQFNVDILKNLDKTC